ncbi:hypothetical protein [Streptomyces sp. URMC 129]|uniref:hypothetical protein n=1 Tax=Streptomyces sp. URMC 129 TaxID=3423407 RepID=UPI003F1BD364
MTVGASTLLGGVAQADEHYSGNYTHNGPAVTLIDVGQIDDPAEDVLEHASILGGDTVQYD